jgi:protein O-mannosyl-transferase
MGNMGSCGWNANIGKKSSMQTGEAMSNTSYRIPIRLEFFICLFLVTATLTVYWQVRNFDFVEFDDDIYIIGNPHVRAGLSWESLGWAFAESYAANWHPLTWLSHIFDVEFYGMNAGLHHLSNVFFHIANALLLFFVFRQMTGDLWQSGFIASMFALHPLHVESVAWISERKDVLSTFFWILTMASYVRYVRQPGIRNYLAAFFFFTLGLMSKAMMMTLPFVLLLIDYWPLGRLVTEKRRVIFEKIPLIALTVVSLIVTFFTQKKWGAVGAWDVYPFTLRTANALISYVRYIGKMFCPSDMAFFYPYSHLLSWWKSAGAFLMLVLLSLSIMRNARQEPYLITGWLWFIGTLVPVIGLIQVGSQAMADRYTYIPYIGLFIMLAWGIPKLLFSLRSPGFVTKIQKPRLQVRSQAGALERDEKQQCGKVMIAAVTAGIFTIIMSISNLQVRYWRDSISLFEHALDVTHNNRMAHSKIGSILYRQGKTEAAAAHYSEALRIKPDDANAHNNMGLILARQGRTDEAIGYYKEALRLAPGLAIACNNMGIALEKQGKRDEAIRYYSQAVALKPDYAGAFNNLGLVLLRQGETQKAIAYFQTSLNIRPDHAETRNNMGAALVRNGRQNEAIVHFRKALELNPDYVRAYNNLKKLSETRQ